MYQIQEYKNFARDVFGLIGDRFNLFGKYNARSFAGYRALSQDYTDGSGDDKFKWNAALCQPPVFGLLVQLLANLSEGGSAEKIME